MSDGNSFTVAEIERIQDAFWRGGHAEHDEGYVRCPKPQCPGPVHVEVPPTYGYPRQMTATCDGCHTSSSFASAPEEGPRFTEDQIRTFVDQHRRGRRSACPVDGTPLKIVVTPGLNGTAHDIACPRCGAYGELKAYPEEEPAPGYRS
jgi:hypothetical protein